MDDDKAGRNIAVNDVTKANLVSGDGSQGNMAVIQVTFPQSPPPPPPPPPSLKLIKCDYDSWDHYGSIPGRARRFVGRHEELRSLENVILSPNGPVMTMVEGGEGVGKTEFVCEFARQNWSRFPDGCFFLDMSSGSPSALLQIPRESFRDPAEVRENFKDHYEALWNKLQSQFALFIYDDLRSLDGIERWLPRSGRAQVIATSSKNIAHTWQRFKLPPMNDKDAEQLLMQTLDSEMMLKHGRRILADSKGYPYWLIQLATALELRDGRLPMLAGDPAQDAIKLYNDIFSAFNADVRLLLLSLALFNHNGTRPWLLASCLQAVNVSGPQYESALAFCRRLNLIRGEENLRWSESLAEYGVKADRQLIAQLRAVAMKAMEFRSAAINGDISIDNILSFNQSPAVWNRILENWRIEVLP